MTGYQHFMKNVLIYNKNYKKLLCCVLILLSSCLLYTLSQETHAATSTSVDSSHWEDCGGHGTWFATATVHNIDDIKAWFNQCVKKCPGEGGDYSESPVVIGTHNGACGNLYVGDTCWVCPSTESTYDNPKLIIRQFTNNGFVGSSYLEQITLTGVTPGNDNIENCGWIWRFGAHYRFCTRISFPEQNCEGLSERQKQTCKVREGEPLNNTHLDTTGKGSRPLLCGFEDWCDFSDPPEGTCAGEKGNFSPFHHNTPNPEQLDPEEAALTGLIAGAAIGAAVGAFMPAAFLILAPIGGALGAAVGAITAWLDSEYNRIVNADIGCVEVPIATVPPAYPHEIPDGGIPRPPRVEAAAECSQATINDESCDNTFYTPKVIIVNRDTGNSYELQYSVPAEYKSTNITDGAPKGTAHPGPPDNLSGLPASPVCTSIATDGRQFCAHVYADKPDEICVYEYGTNAVGEINKVIGCKKRSKVGIPFPSVEEPADQDPANPSMVVNFGPEKLVLHEMTLAGKHIGNGGGCGYIEQLQFCAIMPCEENNRPEVDASGRLIQTGKLCEDYKQKLCLKSIPMTQFEQLTVVERLEDPGAGSVVEGAPNKNFKDCQGFDTDTWIYEPAACLPGAKDADGRCTNYGNCTDKNTCTEICEPTACIERCVIPITDLDGDGKCDEESAEAACTKYANPDPGKGLPVGHYDKDPRTQRERLLSTEELGLCIDLPKFDVTFDLNSTDTTSRWFDITIPKYCNEVKVTLVGGGASGASVCNGCPFPLNELCYNHSSGGAGAKGVWVIEDTANKAFRVKVGRGSNAFGGDVTPEASGDDSRLEFTDPNTSTTYYLSAGGGYNGIKDTTCAQQELDASNNNANNLGCLGKSVGNGGTLDLGDMPDASYQAAESNNGESGTCGFSSPAGGNGPGGGTPYLSCTMGPREITPGAGGCAHDTGYAPTGLGRWRRGAHGQVRIECIDE